MPSKVISLKVPARILRVDPVQGLSYCDAFSDFRPKLLYVWMSAPRCGVLHGLEGLTKVLNPGLDDPRMSAGCVLKHSLWAAFVILDSLFRTFPQKITLKGITKPTRRGATLNIALQKPVANNDWSSDVPIISDGVSCQMQDPYEDVQTAIGI